MSRAEGSVDELLSMIERGELHLPEMQRQDATVINAPSSINSASKGRGPEMNPDPQGRLVILRHEGADRDNSDVPPA